MKVENCQHFSHKHILIHEGEQIYCKACELLIIEPLLGCLSCTYYLHDHCLNTPRSLQHPSHPDHSLTLLPIPTYPTGAFSCNACGSHGTCFSYSCAHCEFDLHMNCALFLSATTKIVEHPHALKLTFNHPQIFFSLIFLRTLKNSAINLTSLSNLQKPATLEGAQGTYNPTLKPPNTDVGKNPHRGNHPQIFACNICGAEVDKQFWSYYCRDCDFGIHLGCTKHGQQHFCGASSSRSNNQSAMTQPSGAVDAVDRHSEVMNETTENQLALLTLQNQIHYSQAVADHVRWECPRY